MMIANKPSIAINIPGVGGKRERRGHAKAGIGGSYHG
jgi:hypothetical protein